MSQNNIVIRAPNLKGKRFGRWVVLERKGLGRFGDALWECQCDCGVIRIVSATSLSNNRSKSCGCLTVEASKTRKKHGKSGSPEHHAWTAMKSRCNHKQHPEYHHYGGREITVCETWVESFENFFADMGEKPTPEHSLDRIDNNGNYQPDNCRWATNKEQQNNKRNNKWFYAISPIGRWFKARSQSLFAEKYGFYTSTHICNCLSKRRKTYKGWKFYYAR